ncbi:hypothetical protein [Brevibacillus choshinensis]|uniref:Uncharacterized protein n=1 Tax=Brevibacillus choshinensis TaxID=54911 RepID=A0ABX7FWW2_BRECH|nr:hypothetical protein [Brevibacillus choshinensis]QRG70282.1 hypothetical protein JNE38_14890 [Brevibacillus choshinensis]
MTDLQVKKANEQLQELGRTLITFNFSRRGGKADHSQLIQRIVKHGDFR